MSFAELSRYICERAFSNREATHVVTEVLWGANVFAIFEQQKNSNDERETIQGELSVELRKAGSLLSGGVQARLEATGTTTAKVSNLHIEFSGDLEMNSVPITIQDALNMIKTIPESIARMNGGKGVQVQFTLSPIDEVLQFVRSSVRSSLETRILRVANAGLVSLIESTFDESLLLQQKVQHVVALAATFRATHLDNDEVRRMNREKVQLDMDSDQFRRQLAVLLKELRTSLTVELENGVADRITGLIRQHDKDESQRTSQFLDKFKHIKKKCEVLERLTSMNVQCASPNEELGNFSAKNTYILRTTSSLVEQQLSQFDQMLREFIDLIKKNDQQTQFIFVHNDDQRLLKTIIEHRPKTTSAMGYERK